MGNPSGTTPPHPGPAVCPVCDHTVTPEWGNVDRTPRWRHPDHPNPHPDATGACVASRWAATDRDCARARRRAELDAARTADPDYQAALDRVRATSTPVKEAA